MLRPHSSLGLSAAAILLLVALVLVFPPRTTALRLLSDPSSSPAADPVLISVLSSISSSLGFSLWGIAPLDATTTMSDVCSSPYITCRDDAATGTTVVAGISIIDEARLLEGKTVESFSELWRLEGLELIELYGDGLVGELPAIWGQLANLKYLDVCPNSISGGLPSTWGNLRRLENLFVCANSLTGTIPPSWGEMVSLQALSISVNSLSGSFPREFSKLTKLERLIANSNFLSGDLPASWASLEKLWYLELSYNALNGSLPREWSAMTSLEELYVSDNKLTGELPSEFSAWQKIRYIDFSSNSLLGKLPASWASMSSLEYLALEKNSLHGSIPPELASLQHLNTLYLHHNSFSGGLPQWSSGMPSLALLSLYSNKLTGCLDSDWSSMTSLREVHLYDNRFECELPRAWGLLSNLQKLTLDKNLLSGNVPVEWSAMQNLQLLGLSSNSLGGVIPPEFKGLTSLQMFAASNNSFVGGVETLLQVPSLQSLDMSRNLLSGSLSFVTDVGDALVKLNLSSNVQFDRLLEPSVFFLASESRRSALVIDLTGIEFSCPFPSDASIRRESSSAFSELLVRHDPCVSNYSTFLLYFCLPVFVSLCCLLCVRSVLLYGRWKHSAVGRIVSRPAQNSSSGLSYTWASHRRLKVFRLLLFSYMLYDIANDITVYKSMLSVVDYAAPGDPCTLLNDRGQFYNYLPWAWSNYDDAASQYPDFICDADFVTNCQEAGSRFTNFSQYLHLMQVMWEKVGSISPSFQTNIDTFASICTNFIIVDGSIPECSYVSAPTLGPEGCVRTRDVQSEMNQYFKRFIIASIVVVALKELCKVAYILYIWVAAPARKLGPGELSIVGESPLMLLLVWRRAGFLEELLLTRKSCRSHLQVLIYEDVLEGVNQLFLVVWFAVKISKEGIAFGVMFSIASSLLKLCKTVYNIASSSSETGQPQESARGAAVVHPEVAVVEAESKVEN